MKRTKGTKPPCPRYTLMKNSLCLVVVASVLGGSFFRPAMVRAQFGGFQCLDFRGIPVSQVPSLTRRSGEARYDGIGRPIILYNEARVTRLARPLRLFLFAHECAHHVLGHVARYPTSPIPIRRAMENAADCWAAQTLQRWGVMDDTDIAMLQRAAASWPEDWEHAPGRERARLIGRCTRAGQLAASEPQPAEAGLRRQGGRRRGDLADELLRAAAEGRSSDVRRLLEEGADPDARNAGGTALVVAAGAGSIGSARLLLEAGADVNASWDESQFTALINAALNDLPSLARMLLARGAEIDHVSEAGLSALHVAALHGSTAVTTILLEFGADIELRSDGDDTPLHLAALMDEASVVEVLLEAGAIVDARNGRGRTPLLIALRREQNEEIAEMLIANGADVNARDYEDGAPPLRLAQTTQSIRMLLEAGADVHLADRMGRTPLHEGLPLRSLGAGKTRLLIEAGADVNSVDRDGRTPLFGHHFVDVDSLLLAAGADVNAEDHRGNTPLFVLIQMMVEAELYVDPLRRKLAASLQPAWTRTVELLVASGATVDERILGIARRSSFRALRSAVGLPQ